MLFLKETAFGSESLNYLYKNNLSIFSGPTSIVVLWLVGGGDLVI